jgi:DNA-binding transcriptional ArsR family regulator
MVQQSSPSLDAVFGALADPTRRAIVARLAEGEASVSQLSQPFDMSLPAVAKHLRVLADAGLVEQRKEGRTRWCRLVALPLRDVQAWVSDYTRFWEGQLDSLAAHLHGPASGG